MVHYSPFIPQDARLDGGKRSSSPVSLNSSYNVLPPIRPPSPLDDRDRPPEDFNFSDEDDLARFCVVRLAGVSSGLAVRCAPHNWLQVSERTLNLLLLELRKLDRDREKIIHPTTMAALLDK